DRPGRNFRVNRQAVTRSTTPPFGCESGDPPALVAQLKPSSSTFAVTERQPCGNWDEVHGGNRFPALTELSAHLIAECEVARVCSPPRNFAAARVLAVH